MQVYDHYYNHDQERRKLLCIPLILDVSVKKSSISILSMHSLSPRDAADMVSRERRQQMASGSFMEKILEVIFDKTVLYSYRMPVDSDKVQSLLQSYREMFKNYSPQKIEEGGRVPDRDAGASFGSTLPVNLRPLLHLLRSSENHRQGKGR